jgi:diguanylate cyclase
VAEAEVISVSEKRFVERLAMTKRVHKIVCAVYLYETLVLAGFWAFGYCQFWVVAAFGFIAAATNGSVFIGQRTRWIKRFTEPSLFFFQQLSAHGLGLFLMLAAPQIAIQPFAVWMGTVAFGFLAPKRTELYVSFGAILVFIAVGLVVVGPRLEIPTRDLPGQMLTLAVVCGAFGRGVIVARFVESLRKRVKERNEALRTALSRIEILAQHDELTGLPNRRALMQWLTDQLRQSDRNDQPLTVAVIDLDHFKRVNDRYGHAIGDLVLQRFSECGLAAIRTSDRLGRVGGEEFLVGLFGTPLEEAEEPLQRIRAKVASLDWSDIDRRLNVTVTIGAACYRCGETIEELIQRADAALYRGKRGGRDCVVLADRPSQFDLQLAGAPLAV